MPSRKLPISIVWHKCTDLRLHDHGPTLAAHRQPYPVVHLFIFDPFWFRPLPITRLPKTGPLRAKFLREAVEDLRASLRRAGSDLVVRRGRSADVFSDLGQMYRIQAVYAYEEVCSQEVKIERAVARAVHPAPLTLEWGFTLYHRDDLPPGLLRRFPHSYTGFRKAVQERCTVRPPRNMGPDDPPLRFRPAVLDLDPGVVPSLVDLGLTDPVPDDRAACRFVGGETAGMGRVREYFWDRDLLRHYVGATNTMTPGQSAIAADSTTKLAPWLAHGCISPQWLYRELEAYERQRVRNKATGWLKHELVWRDYLRFGGLAECWGDSIFKPAAIHEELWRLKWDQHRPHFDMWVEGRTGYPFVDCFMKELAATGYTTHCGRECVAWFFVRDLATEKGWMDWRMGAEYFEYILVDFEPTANWGNWAYRIATTTPSSPLDYPYTRSTQMLHWAKAHDPSAAWVKKWLPVLEPLPPLLALEPWHLLMPAALRLADPPDDRAWGCPACTFLNAGQSPRCGMCRVGRRPLAIRGLRYGIDYPLPCIQPPPLPIPEAELVELLETQAKPATPSSPLTGDASVGTSSPLSPLSAGAADWSARPQAGAAEGQEARCAAPKSRQRNRLQTDRH